MNSEVSPSIPPADQPPKMRSDIASRTLTKAGNISEVAEFGQKAPVTVESSGKPAVRPEDVLDRQIRERLQALKDKYKEQFFLIKDKSTTSNYCKPGSWEPLIVETAGELGQFVNEYKTDEWHFLFNVKDPQWQQHFDQSTMVAFQYEYLSEAKQSKMMLPKTIFVEQEVLDKKNLEVIHKYASRHDSEQFKDEYLTTTVNGKHIARVADDFGLIIEGIEPESVTSEDVETFGSRSCR
ncbi:hypothetical protein, partial [Endozoicomonas sp. ONNA2]|uniref:hypothetical protein n=1 Tax=Endozoicomonas sp. ONNA2 TaxID=2828741 RepID=UPI002148FB8C